MARNKRPDGSTSWHVTRAVQAAQAALADAMALAECKGGAGKFCREGEAAVGWRDPEVSQPNVD